MASQPDMLLEAQHSQYLSLSWPVLHHRMCMNSVHQFFLIIDPSGPCGVELPGGDIINFPMHEERVIHVRTKQGARRSTVYLPSA